MDDGTRDRLEEAAEQVFKKELRKAKAKNLKAILTNDTIRKMYLGYDSVPTRMSYQGYSVVTGYEYYPELKTQSRNLSSHKLGDMVSGNDDEPDQQFKYVIEFPEYINDLNKRILIIDIELNLTNNEGILEKFEFEPRLEKLVAIQPQKTWYEAEEDCVRQGGHLPSLHSDDENIELGKKLGNGTLFMTPPSVQYSFWIGGRIGNGKWTWSDGSKWDYTKWDNYTGDREPDDVQYYGLVTAQYL